MQIPVIRGVIERRILVNYRVDPAVLVPLLPAPFRPKIYRGMGMVGICLIRLAGLRPAFLPAWMGLSSENAAHRTAVEWEEGSKVGEGVYIRRRDTNSWASTLLGGRIFPGVHHHARFDVKETAEHFDISLTSDDQDTKMSVRGHITNRLPATSIFRSLDEASDFFQSGSLGYSATSNNARFQGLSLHCQDWCVTPLEVEKVTSSFFDDTSQFPQGSIEFDCALLMRNLKHEWHGERDLCCVAQPQPRLSAEASRV